MARACGGFGKFEACGSIRGAEFRNLAFHLLRAQSIVDCSVLRGQKQESTMMI